jgi:hypothetical protein
MMALLLAAGVMACGGNAGGDDAATDGASGNEANAESGSGDGELPGLATTVTLKGGKHAGTYSRDTKNGACVDYQQLGLGAVDMGESEGGFLGVDFGTRAKSAAGTDDFSMSLSFAAEEGMLNPVSYRIDPRKRRGTGTARVTGSAPHYTVQVTGRTPEGVDIEATIRCKG